MHLFPRGHGRFSTHKHALSGLSPLHPVRVLQSDSLLACGTALSGQSPVADLSTRLLSLLERLWAAAPVRLAGPAGTRLACALLRVSAALPPGSALSDQRLAQVSQQQGQVRRRVTEPARVGRTGRRGY